MLSFLLLLQRSERQRVDVRQRLVLQRRRDGHGQRVHAGGDEHHDNHVSEPEAADADEEGGVEEGEEEQVFIVALNKGEGFDFWKRDR